MKKVLAISAVAMVLTACGGGSDSKGLFSLWKDTQTGHALDLRGASFNTSMYPIFILEDGTQCSCEAVIIGDHGSGSFGLSRCISTPYNYAVNDQCKALNGLGTYSNDGTTLTITGPQINATYR